MRRPERSGYSRLFRMNEYYARDTSKKIKSVFKSKGMSGKHLTGTVLYGYLWDESRTHWLVDEEAAGIVRRIFSLTMEGYRLYQIPQILKQQKVEIPSVHLARHGEGVNKGKASRIGSCRVLQRARFQIRIHADADIRGGASHKTIYSPV